MKSINNNGGETMTTAEHIAAAIEHLTIARAALLDEHEPDGYGSKSRALRFVENALLALSQAGTK